MPQQTVPAIIVPFIASEVTAVELTDAVMPGKLLIQERVIGSQQFLDRTVRLNLTPEKELGLLHHRLSQGIVESSE